MEIKGELKEIIFQNDVNGYTIGVLDTEEEELTVVGYLPFIAIGDNLKLIGKYVTHPHPFYMRWYTCGNQYIDPLLLLY